ncbi:uncharacterized membrane protein YcaP (DUF421 family) [Dyadobacter arcticus]|uniref:Uncharacterized membrane protein YcaP (DUF421 family) n=1 Tax=Dyadobacter arcticus TaxID=1078754 RepID=A0ABX0UIY2_9BACT|nr:uncharacterized membrane protein YcaP (DUF421 family) [Dyadobacter arcticus]
MNNDLLSNLRRNIHTTSMEGIDSAHMERNGQISCVLKSGIREQ